MQVRFNLFLAKSAGPTYYIPVVRCRERLCAAQKVRHLVGPEGDIIMSDAAYQPTELGFLQEAYQPTELGFLQELNELDLWQEPIVRPGTLRAFAEGDQGVVHVYGTDMSTLPPVPEELTSQEFTDW